MQKNISIQKKATAIGVISVLVALTIMGFVTKILYEHTVNLLTENLKQRLLAIVTTAVVEFDAEDVAALVNEKDWQKPQWTKVVTHMKKIRENNEDILFVYMFRKDQADPQKLVFVADSHSLNPYANTDEDISNNVDANNDGNIDDADQLQWPGQDYPPDPPEEAFRAFSSPITNREMYEDQYGKVITGYAPIKYGDGRTEAVLAADIKANDFLTITKQTLYPFLAFIALLTGVIFILSWGLIKIWNKTVGLMRSRGATLKSPIINRRSVGAKCRSR